MDQWTHRNNQSLFIHKGADHMGGITPDRDELVVGDRVSEAGNIVNGVSGQVSRPPLEQLAVESVHGALAGARCQRVGIDLCFRWWQEFLLPFRS
jgi:hypothetical protein